MDSERFLSYMLVLCVWITINEAEFEFWSGLSESDRRVSIEVPSTVLEGVGAVIPTNRDNCPTVGLWRCLLVVEGKVVFS